MAQNDSKKIAQALYDALTNDDHQRLKQLLHPDFQGHTTKGMPFNLGGDYAGPEAMCHDFWDEMARHFVVFAYPSDFCQLEDGRILVYGCYRGEARACGEAFDAEFTHILSFKDGQISALNQLTDSERWCSAVRVD